MDSIRLTYDVPVAPPAAFYLYAGEIGRWWPGMYTHDPAHFRGMSVEARAGGRVRTHLDGENVEWGRVTVVRPPHLISWHQWWLQSPDHPSLVTARFLETETGARFEFDHGGWTPHNVHQRSRFVDWPVILAHYVAHTRAHARGRCGSRRNGLARRPRRGVA